MGLIPPIQKRDAVYILGCEDMFRKTLRGFDNVCPNWFIRRIKKNSRGLELAWDTDLDEVSGLRKYLRGIPSGARMMGKYVTLNVSPHHFDRIQFCDGRWLVPISYIGTSLPISTRVHCSGTSVFMVVNINHLVFFWTH